MIYSFVLVTTAGRSDLILTTSTGIASVLFSRNRTLARQHRRRVRFRYEGLVMDHRSLASSLLFGLFVTLVGGNQDVHEYWEEGHDDNAVEDVLGWGFVDLSEDFGNPRASQASQG